ncbi:hypothetical protein LCGC14_0375960 [marine sediment metagenome]|uniref:Uncharacterized protein n=1 Tax=marine sediment metagenome TaxID=412755 RepID=A0A0F9WCH5_9ZZZZ
MDKTQAIKEAHQQRTEEAESRFKDRVATALYNIDRSAKDLRAAKKILADLEYQAPKEIDID